MKTAMEIEVEIEMVIAAYEVMMLYNPTSDAVDDVLHGKLLRDAGMMIHLIF